MINDTQASPVRSRPSVILLALYYLAILVAVIILHGRGGMDTPQFIYQGF